MIIYVTGKRVMDNQVVFEQAQYDHVPSVGLQYLSDGQHNFIYIFSTWNGQIDSNYPPNIQDGTVAATYWYLEIGGGGDPAQLASVGALLLGGQGDNAVFAADNPIATVNAAPWGGGKTVSTATGSVDIGAKSELQAQDFVSWVKLWGTGQILSDHLVVPQGSDCVATGVYARPQLTPPAISRDDIAILVSKFVNPKDLVADYLDEHRRKDLDLIIKYAGPAAAPDRLSKLLQNVKDVSPKLAKQALLKVKADAARLSVVEKILTILSTR